MDPQTFMGIATTVTKLRMWPYFDVAHFVLMCLAVRDDVQQSGSVVFARKHPFACYVSCMIMCFAGGMLSNLLIGESPLSPLKNEKSVLLASAVWYLIFYSPFDLAYKMVRFLPLRLVIVVFKEVQRTKNIYDGVKYAFKLYPNEYLYMVVLGVTKGAGANLLRPIARITTGLWLPNRNEFLQPDFITKASLITSVFFILEHERYITIPHAILYFAVVVFLVYFRLSAVLLGVQDPFVPFENLFCSVFMGGMWDALKRVTTEPANDSNDVKATGDKKKD